MPLNRLVDSGQPFNFVWTKLHERPQIYPSRVHD